MISCSFTTLFDELRVQQSAGQVVLGFSAHRVWQYRHLILQFDMAGDDLVFVHL
jgi:hypothetical protein